ncbi:hypothetical protein ACSVDA_00590 [Cytobacillus sp. Hm23]
MIIYIEPTLHIVDTQSDFILTTKDKNLKLNISKKQKELTYQLLKQLKNDENITPLLKDKTSFEYKLFYLLRKHNIISVEKYVDETISVKGILRIFGPLEFLKIIQEQISDRSYIEEMEFGHSLRFHREEGHTKDVHVYLSKENMYITTDQLNRVANITTNNTIINKYAAYVFLEQFQNKTVDLDNAILKIDLTMYTNEQTFLITSPINENNFSNSILVDRILSNFEINFDYETFFPLVYCVLYCYTSKVQITALGFDKEDTIRNLIILLMQDEEDHSWLQIIGNDREYEINKDSFFHKFLNIYFSKTVAISYDQGIKVIKSDSLSVSYTKNKVCNENSLFLTLLMNNQFSGKELTVNGNKILSTKLQESIY